MTFGLVELHLWWYTFKHMEGYPGSPEFNFSDWESNRNPEKKDKDAVKKAEQEAKRAAEKAAEEAEKKAQKEAEKEARAAKAAEKAKKSGILDEIFGTKQSDEKLSQDEQKSAGKKEAPKSPEEQTMEDRKRSVAQDITRAKVAELEAQAKQAEPGSPEQAEIRAGLQFANELESKLANPELEVDPTVEAAYEETLSNLTPEMVEEYEAVMEAEANQSINEIEDSPTETNEAITEPEVAPAKIEPEAADNQAEASDISETEAVAAEYSNETDQFDDAEEIEEKDNTAPAAPTVSGSGTDSGSASPSSSNLPPTPHSGSGGSGGYNAPPPPPAPPGGGGGNYPPNRPGGPGGPGRPNQPPQSPNNPYNPNQYPPQPPQRPNQNQNQNRPNRGANILKKTGETMASAIVGGIIGLMVGEAHGRNVGRKKTERCLKPEIAKIKRQIETKETIIRQQARQIQEQSAESKVEKATPTKEIIPPVVIEKTDQKVVEKPVFTPLERLKVVEKEKQVYVPKPLQIERKTPTPLEKPKAAESPELVRKLERHDVSRPGRLLVGHEIAPPRKQEVKLEHLSTQKLLEMGKKIKIDNLSIESLFKTNQIDRAGLVYILSESLRGGDLTRAFEKVELGRERQAERAREFRHDDQGLQTADSQGTSSAVKDNQFITAAKASGSQPSTAKTTPSSTGQATEPSVTSLANIQPNLRTVGENEAAKVIKQGHSALLTLLIAALLFIILIVVILLTRPWQ